MVFLVRSLGGVAYSRVRPAAGRKPGLARGREVHHRSDAYLLDIRLPPGVEPFRLERKRAKYEAFGAGRPMRFVDRIEPAGEAETVCIQVAAADSLYVTDDFLVTHNTLNASFIICDEAQNTTPEQMKMFLTRIGFGSRAVVTGDVTQVDVQGGRSGLLGLEHDAHRHRRARPGCGSRAATSCATASCRTSSTPTSGRATPEAANASRQGHGGRRRR